MEISFDVHRMHQISTPFAMLQFVVLMSPIQADQATLLTRLHLLNLGLNIAQPLRHRYDMRNVEIDIEQELIQREFGSSRKSGLRFILKLILGR